MTHLSTEAILDQLDARTGSPEPEVAAHVEECATCAREVDSMRRLLAFVEAEQTNEPPTRVVEWAEGLFRPVRALEEGHESVFGRIARLVFDSFEQPLASGVRAAATPGPISRKLLYRAGDVDIDVRVETDPDNKISLSGQILSSSAKFFENAPVRLEAGGESRYETATNPIGEFSFEGVPQDTYHLSMDLPNGPITLFCVYRDHLRN